MENIAYLHLAFAYEDRELFSLGSIFSQTPALDWKRLSSGAWKYLLPLALVTSILNAITHVLALEPGHRGHAVINTKGRKIQKTTTQKILKSPSLHKGDEGEKVSSLQQRLRVAGFYYGNPTGIFGPITQESVKRFQKAYKLEVDGVVGPATDAKLATVATGNSPDIPKKPGDRDQLSLGDRGEAVRILQEDLAKLGYLETPPNGYYGSYTADAVTRFQKKQRLEINGVAGPTTRAKLYSLAKNSPEGDFSILELQRRLQERGFYKGQLNGEMAGSTKKALKQAQEFYGISAVDLKNNKF